MSSHLNLQQNLDWNEAVVAVGSVASSTDSQSGSKYYLDAMARFVREEPEMVLRLLAAV